VRDLASERLALEIKVLTAFFSGATVKESSERFHITQYKVRQIIKQYKAKKRHENTT